MMYFSQLLANGIMIGGIYSLVAIGMVIIYKSTGVINFAQGQLLSLGALILWFLTATLKIPLLISFLIAIICSGLIGYIVELLFLRPMTGQPLMSVIIMTIGLSGLLDSTIYPIFGAGERSFPHLFPAQGLKISTIHISYEHMFAFVTAVVLVCLFMIFFKKTRYGKIMRAAADGHNIARSCGIKVGMVFSVAWVLASISAMVAGYLYGSVGSVYPAISVIVMSVFPVVILGGLESIRGCMLAGPIVGIAETMASGYVDPYTQGGSSEVVPYVIILLVLIVKPHGIFGEKEIERI